MMRPEFAPRATQFAQLTGGTLRWGNSGEECVFADGSFVYWPFSGQVKLHRHGHVVTVLGSWDDPTEVLVAAYERVTAPEWATGVSA